MYIAVLLSMFHSMKSFKMAVMLLKELRSIFTVQLSLMHTLVVILYLFDAHLNFGGIGYGTLQPHNLSKNENGMCSQAELHAVAMCLFM